MKKIYILGPALGIILCAHAAQAALQECTITWTPNSEADLAGYRVYAAPISGGYQKGNPALDVPKGQSTAKCSSLNLPSPSTYFFAVTAYDTTGNVSNFSNEVSRYIGEVITIPLAYVTRVKADADGATVTISGPATKLYVSSDKIPFREVPEYVPGSATHRFDKRFSAGDSYICFTAENAAGIKTEQGCDAVTIGPEPDTVAPSAPVITEIK